MLRVLTANLYNGRIDPASLADVVDEADPDVVAAQELAPDAGEVLAARYPHGRIEPAWDNTGVALAARVPISAERRHLPHRDAMTALVDLDGKPLKIWCVHLANPVAAPPPVRTRRAQVHAVESAIEGDEPLLLVGDLNATPIWPAYRRLTRHLDDGVAEWAANSGRRPSPTWGYRAWMPPWLRIDHALVRGVAIRRARTMQIRGGDHRALIVDVA